MTIKVKGQLWPNFAWSHFPSGPIGFGLPPSDLFEFGPKRSKVNFGPKWGHGSSLNGPIGFGLLLSAYVQKS